MKKKIAAWVCISAAFLAFTAAISFAAADSASEKAAASVSERAESGIVSTASKTESPLSGTDSNAPGTDSIVPRTQSTVSGTQSTVPGTKSIVPETESLESGTESGLSLVEIGTDYAVDAAANLMDIDPEELKKNLVFVLKVVSSEDFQSLISYKEVKELIGIILNKSAEFVQTEPELTEKILVAGGLDERYVGPVMIALNYLSQGEQSVDSFLGTDKGKETSVYAKMILEDPETQDLLSQILAALGGTLND